MAFGWLAKLDASTSHINSPSRLWLDALQALELQLGLGDSGRAGHANRFRLAYPELQPHIQKL